MTEYGELLGLAGLGLLFYFTTLFCLTWRRTLYLYIYIQGKLYGKVAVAMLQPSASGGWKSSFTYFAQPPPDWCFLLFFFNLNSVVSSRENFVTFSNGNGTYEHFEENFQRYIF